MTKLFNLESYIDYCQYAQIFNNCSDKLTGENREFPTREAYKILLDKYAGYSYLRLPVHDYSSNNLDSGLKINNQGLSYLAIGNQLTPGEKQRLLIISDTLDLMTLTTSNILARGDGYLYSSAYHYWNHYTEIQNYEITKPLVFIDLDSFGISSLIPINFKPAENSFYQIPILDTRTGNKILLNEIYNCPGIYNNICDDVARFLLTGFTAFSTSEGINQETVDHLSNYLQKINLLEIIQVHIHQESVNLVVEIYHNNQIFYKHLNVSIPEVANAVCKHINFLYLNQIANQYPQYQFVLVSQYNIFEEIQQGLSNFICLKSPGSEFAEIWHQKHEVNFPLFGIYLDEIEFAVAISGKEEWIKLADEKDAISYEGKAKTLIGNIPGLNQDFVSIPQGQSVANLPIKLNGNDFCINNVSKDYQIKIENYKEIEENEKIRVQIQFNLQPGSVPELKVKDLEDKYIITTSLIDRQRTDDSQQKYYSYILPEQITANRQQRSLSQIERLKRRSDFQDFISDLEKISSRLDKINNRGSQKDYELLSTIIKSAYQKLNQKPDLLQFIDNSSNEPIIIQLIEKLKQAKLDRIVDIVNDKLNSHQSLNKNERDFLNFAIIFIGKLYQLSQYLSSSRLFQQLQLQFNNTTKIRNSNLLNEYLQCLARTAVNKELQNQYFNLFESQYNLEKSQYLWGYGNILLWYYNFNSLNKFCYYQEHFTKIINYLLSKNYRSFDSIYKKFAFLSIIYLLTFRADDSNFCQLNSTEFILAKQVIENFKNDRIILTTVSREKPLNQYFQEMIEGCSTKDEINNLLQGDVDD